MDRVEEKDLLNMLTMYTGKITDCVFDNKETAGVLAVVNAANPTLMGSRQAGIDASIHEAVNERLEQIEPGKLFKDKIKQELDGEEIRPDRTIRCPRGEAVVTRGHTFCDYIIHVVGCENDSDSRWCSSKCTGILESCYHNIMEQLKSHPEIETLIVPIVGSGNYGIPFSLAARIAIATIGNDLVQKKKEDPEYFDYMALRKVIFCIYSADDEDKKNEFIKILNEYKRSFLENHRVVYQKSWQSQIRYIKNIVKYDETRGYFAVAKMMRIVLAVFRLIFVPILCLKDIFGKYDWQLRRKVTEFITVTKLLIPFGIYGLIHIGCIDIKGVNLLILYSGLTLYCVADTITYLLALIFFADIQRPSANIIRSMILLLINYLEVSLEIAVLYYLDNLGILKFREAIQYGILGKELMLNGIGYWSTYIYYANVGIKFFFKTLAFGYFIKHLRSRQFRS